MNLSEAEHSLDQYRCFSDLFIRQLQAGARPIDGTPDTLVSPVDGCLSRQGTITRGCLVQAKGIDYSVAELLQDDTFAAQLEGGTFFTLYLRPKDYHRIHCPIDVELISSCSIPGSLFPVKPYMTRNLRGLLSRNERLVFQMNSPAGKMALVCVAATGVGTISTVFDGALPGVAPKGRRLNKGDQIAAFLMGSTVILLFQSGRIEAPLSTEGQEVRVGQTIARWVADTAAGNTRGPGGE